MVQIATMILSATLAITTTTTATATLRCAANVAGGSVHYVKDGAGEDRCFALITPENATTPMPVLMWFHGAGGNAGHCGAGRRDDDGNSLGDLANRHGFALVVAVSCRSRHIRPLDYRYRLVMSAVHPAGVVLR